MVAAVSVTIADYDPNWPKIAADHAAQLAVLGPVLLAVHHIGSTSVPGLSAKPIIDLMPLVTDLAALDAQRGVIESLGYQWHGEYGIPGRRFCILLGGDGHRLVQLHFFEADSPLAGDYIAFREYLRSFPAEARAYEAEKRRARDLHPEDSNGYNVEKSPFVRAALARALAWYAGQSEVPPLVPPHLRDPRPEPLRE
jgi:GrpB-like predicted nucleotidyltransferase (UPF0157 family)